LSIDRWPTCEPGFRGTLAFLCPSFLSREIILGRIIRPCCCDDIMQGGGIAVVSSAVATPPDTKAIAGSPPQISTDTEHNTRTFD
jgi:hypothetical protein